MTSFGLEASASTSLTSLFQKEFYGMSEISDER